MSPLGSQRNFASPSLAKRMALQHLNPPQSQDLSFCQKNNIWNNPLQSIQDDREQADISYLHSLQAQQFPHIPNSHLKKTLGGDDASTAAKKMEIYENPSEHYASINYNGTNDRGPQSSSFGGSHILQHPNSSGGGSLLLKNDPGAKPANFYGYGTSQSQL